MAFGELFAGILNILLGTILQAILGLFLGSSV